MVDFLLLLTSEVSHKKPDKENAYSEKNAEAKDAEDGLFQS